jgi:hypothetical protein
METVFYYIAGRRVLQESSSHVPRVGDEIAMQVGKRDESMVYRVSRVVWGKPDCPPDIVRVHLEISPAEEIR